MKHRLSSVAVVTFGAVLSALFMATHPTQAQADADAGSFSKVPVAAPQTFNVILSGAKNLAPRRDLSLCRG